MAILDLSAAFDTVDHKLLLKILKQNFGFCGKALHWFQNYLRPWSFIVNINCKYSKPIDLKFSVPQGSCSGANLFTCHCSLIIDSLPSAMTQSGFTDDHSIRKSFTTKSHTSEEKTINTIENNLTTIADWMISMWLKFNSDKTEFIMFGSKQMLKYANTSHLNFDTSPIQWSRLVKYLGGHLDSCLTFEEHVKQKSNAAMLNFMEIKAIRPSPTAAACHILVLMLWISHLDYSNAWLYGITKKLLQKYQRIQNMCANLVLNKC